MSDIYQRHFKVTNGPLMAEVERIKAVNKAGWDKYINIAEEIGANTNSIMMLDGHYLSGFKFDHANQPDPKIYIHKDDDSWYPKQNNKIGRALHKRIKTVVTENPTDALDTLGLGKNNNQYAIFGDRHIYWAALITIPSAPPVNYVRVPWLDLKSDKIHSHTEAMLWRPTKDMVAIKGWELEKAIEEWNDREKEY